MIEEMVKIESTFSIKGTLTLPEHLDKDIPLVVMLHGSGPTDRDENVKGMKINAFKELTDAIVPLGIATLRYDKRGVGESGGNYLETGMWDLVDDAIAAIKMLKEDTRINPDKIFLLGHSEGAILAPIINTKVPVNGMILLAGAAESVKAAIMRQSETALNEIDNMKGLKGAIFRLLKITKKARKQQEKMYKKIEESTEPVIKIQMKKINAKWMKEHFTYNVTEDLKNVECPTLAITGEKDIQVLPEHAKTIAELVNGYAEYHIIPDLTHLLRRQETTPSMLSLNKDYKNLIKQPIDSELIEIIANWLKKYTG